MITIKLTVLGNNGPYPGAGGACSGYLLNDGDTKILLDCGNGVLSNLQKILRFDELDAIILTHLHSDHMSDMMVLRYAIQVKLKKQMITKPITVYAPPEPLEEFARLNIPEVFDLKPISEELEIQIGKLSFSFRQMKHPVMAFSVGVQNGEKKFVFSGDTAWNANIIEHGKDADLLMLDAGFKNADKVDENVPHLTAGECGKVAAEAGAKRLLLTHFWPEYNIGELILEAKEHFTNVDATRLMESYEI